MTYTFAQDPFFNNCQKEKCVLLGVAFIGGKAAKAGKMRK
jgi:hypothetical protein